MHQVHWYQVCSSKVRPNLTACTSIIILASNIEDTLSVIPRVLNILQGLITTVPIEVIAPPQVVVMVIIDLLHRKEKAYSHTYKVTFMEKSGLL